MEVQKEDLKQKINIFEESIQLLHLTKSDDASTIFEVLKRVDKELKDFFDEESDQNLKKRIIKIIQLFNMPVTIIYEPYYVDRVYRDEYYQYYSKKHFCISRNTKRLIFVQGIYEKEDFLNSNCEMHEQIERDMIGMIVLKPTKTIGRILLRPSHLNIQRCYVRTTKFELSVYGRIYSIEAFPFSGQDSEVMTCAEVNIWQIMEYFGSRYKDYKTLLPSELLELVKESSDTRLLPSDGLTVEQESFLFMKNGLSPLIYYKYLDYQENDLYKIYEQYTDPAFYEILHFYVESGIPVLLNLREKDNPYGDNHSVTCIGHEYHDINDLPSKMEKVNIMVDMMELDKGKEIKYNSINVFKSWSAYKKYVMLEDHSLPYQIRDLSKLTFEDFVDDQNESVRWEIESFVAPLYRHVFLSADDAYDRALDLIKENFEQICSTIGCNLQEEVPQIIIRLYLASSRSFKDYRIRTVEGQSKEELSEKLFFSQVAYPKFLWVCEYSTFEAYSDHRANGEFVLDATSSKDHSAISIRHGDIVTYRSPVGDIADAFIPTDLRLMKTFAMYESNNLKDSGYIERREA